MNSKIEERTWREESRIRLESLMVAYYLALRGLPIVRARIKLPNLGLTSFPDNGAIDQARMEISNSFFLRLKGLIESRMKATIFEVNWKNEDVFLISIGLTSEMMNDTDRLMFSHLCALRNCLAHNYGLVDERTSIKIPELKVGRYIEIDSKALENWFIWTNRIFDLVQMGATNRKIH
jgi:hypothetical protein